MSGQDMRIPPAGREQPGPSETGAPATFARRRHASRSSAGSLGTETLLSEHALRTRNDAQTEAAEAAKAAAAAENAAWHALSSTASRPRWSRSTGSLELEAVKSAVRHFNLLVMSVDPAQGGPQAENLYRESKRILDMTRRELNKSPGVPYPDREFFEGAFQTAAVKQVESDFEISDRKATKWDEQDRKSTRLNSSHESTSRMPSSA